MKTLLSDFDAVLLDLDGVVYVGPDALSHAAEAIAAVRAADVMCGFVTNNASRTADVVAAHLTDLGIPATPEEVITSPQAAVTVLSDMVPSGSRVLAVGGPGITEELRRRGFRPVSSFVDGPLAVLQGFSPDLSWRDLAEATYAVRAGLPWIATNLDFTFPTPQGAAPGNGSLVRLVADVVGRGPDAVAGKPEPPLLQEAIGRLGAQRPLMVGDRLDTDIEAGARIDIPTLLVMTGVTGVAELLAAGPHERPTYVGADLRVLTDPYPRVEVIDGRPGEVRCRTAEARVVEGCLQVANGEDAMDGLRAAALLCWSHADVGEHLDATAATGGLEEGVARALMA